MRHSWILVALALAGCGSPPGSPLQSAGGPPRTVLVGNRPPQSKDVIDAVLASAGVSLTVSPTCRGVGTESGDTSIGRYLAGFMAEMSSDSTSNWIETRTTDGTTPAGEPAWICVMTLRHRDGDDRWGWGVQFLVRKSDGLVLSDSFSCTGAG